MIEEKKNFNRSVFNSNADVNEYIEDCLDRIDIRIRPNYTESLLLCLDNAKNLIQENLLEIESIEIGDTDIRISLTTNYEDGEDIEDEIIIGDGLAPLGLILSILDVNRDDILDFLEN